jgi:hypothetical protein
MMLGTTWGSVLRHALAVLGLALGANSLALAQVAAEVRSASGVVFAQPQGGQVRVIQTGAKLSVGDTVGTEKGAFALIVFNDGSRVALRPESAIAIRGFSFQPEDPSKDQMSVQLLKGWLRNVSGQIGKRGNQNAFDLKVNDTTIGIRGTDFGVRLCDQECAGQAQPIPEGVLSQSGRLGQLLSSNQPVQRLRDGITPQDLPTSGALFLGDVVASGDTEALLGLDDGTRLVLGPATRLALRAEEDERGRRAVRVDLLQGNLRLATPTQPGARLYGLLVNAGQLLGVRQDTALDVGCEQPAADGEFTCDAANVVLRRGRSEVLTATGLRSLLPGTPQRLLEPSATPPQRSGTTNPGGTTTAQATAQATSPTIEWDTWAPGAHPMARLRTLAQWRQHQTLQSDPTTQGLWLIAQAAPTTTPALPSPSPLTPSTGSLFDPMDIPREAAHPPSVAETPKLGIYTAVFEGQIAMANPQGQIQISAGQGGFAPITPTVPPTALPASPAFMEKDQVLNKQSLTPGQCPR